MLSYWTDCIDYKSTVSRYQWIDEKQKRIYTKYQSCYHECTDKEWDFLNKYGYPNLCLWWRMNPSEKKNLEETITAYQIFWSLYYEHYEDLCLYAIMHRNQPLYPTLDLTSVKFFVSKMKEIERYKEKILALNTPKAKVALLYYFNTTIFTKTLSSYILGGEIYTLNGKERNSMYEMCSSSKKSLYDRFPSWHYGVGIDNLTEKDCISILEHKDELISEYRRIYRETLEEYVISQKGRAFSQRFFQNSFVIYVGRKGAKLLTARKDEFLDETKELLPKPSIERDKFMLSRHEYNIVCDLCHKAEERIEREEKVNAEIRQREWEEKRLKEEARREKYKFNQRNKHPRDSKISFDEQTHIYSLGGKQLQSVTNFVNNSFPQFDAEFHAKKQAEKTGKSVEDVLKMWADKGEESRSLGTALHKRIEGYYQDISFLNTEEDEAFNLFKQFANKITLEPYRTEWAVFDETHNIAGTIDFVDYQNGEYIIYDWKRSDKIIDNGLPVKHNKYGEKGKYPLEHLHNTPYYHYALQLSLYKFILENNYGMIISDLRLGIFHPSYNKPYVLRMPYLEKEINDIFGLRSEVLF